MLGIYKVRESSIWFAATSLWIILISWSRGTTMQEPWGSFLSDTSIFVTQRVFSDLLRWKSVQDAVQYQNLIDAAIFRTVSYMEWSGTYFCARRITSPFLGLLLFWISYPILKLIKRPLPKPLNMWGAMTSCHKSGLDLGEPVSVAFPYSCFLLDLSAFPAISSAACRDCKCLIVSNSGLFHLYWGQLCLYPHLHTEGQWLLHHLTWWSMKYDFQTTTLAPRFVAGRAFAILLFLGILIPKLQLGQGLNMKWMRCHSFSPIVLYDHVTLREAHCILVQGALPSYQGSPAEIGIQDSKKKKKSSMARMGGGKWQGLAISRQR